MEIEQKRLLHNLIEAHVQAYNKIKELDDVDADNDGITNITGFSHAMMEVVPGRQLNRQQELENY